MVGGKSQLVGVYVLAHSTRLYMAGDEPLSTYWHTVRVWFGSNTDSCANQKRQASIRSVLLHVPRRDRTSRSRGRVFWKATRVRNKASASRETGTQRSLAAAHYEDTCCFRPSLRPQSRGSSSAPLAARAIQVAQAIQDAQEREFGTRSIKQL